ncbi:neuroligin-4, X-linked-like [Haliotis cracherodii]|uniref:neuroligin-4, X-linked-like n=1 Tax=Haliotis cracherodii TaxID=6455 RepID=UPI0039E990C1
MFGYVVLSCLATLCVGTDVVLQTRQGQLRGTRTEYFSDEYVDVYNGIPYALPPVGVKRFRPPSPAGAWSGVRDARSARPICPQVHSKPHSTQNEDCLFLNVFAWKSKANTTSPLPVMVFIHGGAFNEGGGSLFRCNALALHSVVVVTFNYRLGALGFLATDDAASPGNYGMLDQVMALKWVRDNIADFGGDPKHVTVFGESAGAVSTSLHLISPLSKGLFDAAITESGVSLSEWGFRTKQDKPSPLDQARVLGKRVGCSETNTTLLVDCLRKVDVKRLTVNDLTKAENRLVWSPVVEAVFGFLPDTPQTLIDRGDAADIPVMRGVNKDELAAQLAWIHGISGGMSLSSATAFLRQSIQRAFTSNQQALQAAIEKVYLTDVQTSDHGAIRSRIIQLLSDRAFYVPTVVETEKQAGRGRSPVYLYEFDYRSPRDNKPVWEGVPHAAELPYVFGAPLLGGSHWTDTDKAVSSRVMGYWTNFAKHGDPSYGHVTWKPFTSKEKGYLSVGNASVMKYDPRSQEVKLWTEVIPKLVQSQNVIIG